MKHKVKLDFISKHTNTINDHDENSQRDYGDFQSHDGMTEYWTQLIPNKLLLLVYKKSVPVKQIDKQQLCPEYNDLEIKIK